MSSGQIDQYALVNPTVSYELAQQLMQQSRQLKRLQLNQRQLCDLELIACGGFSPLDGFMTEADYNAILTSTRLTDGQIWPIPITLDVNAAFAETLNLKDKVALTDLEGKILAFLTVSSIWQPDKLQEANCVFASEDSSHPGIDYLLNQTENYYIGGKLSVIAQPEHYDFIHLRKTPYQLRELFAQLNIERVVAFQTRNPMHRAHQELTLQAMQETGGHLLIHPVVGMTKPGDIDYFTRVRCYEHLLKTYPKDSASLALLPLAMRMAGPKEALLHAIIRRNYGCTHFIVGRDHAGPGQDQHCKPFYHPYAAQELVGNYQAEIGISMIPFQEMVYVRNQQRYLTKNQLTETDQVETISGTEFRQRLTDNLDIPPWFSYPEVLSELKQLYLPKNKRGFTVLFTGLSGAGKSTLANILLAKLLEIGGRTITLLDGDIVRQNLSQELGFSKKDRDINIMRIAFVASEITKHNGIAICAPIAPFKQTRQQMRRLINQYGPVIEIYISTPLAICEQRDPKGLYVKARAGEIKDFTGISSPYETPSNPDISIDTSEIKRETAADIILTKLTSYGLI